MSRRNGSSIRGALSEAWERVVDEVEHQRSQVSATVLIDAKLLPFLRTEFGRRQCVVNSPVDASPVSVRLAAPTAEMIARRLAGWGARVEVLEPAAVRADLARIGAELSKRYI